MFSAPWEAEKVINAVNPALRNYLRQQTVEGLSRFRVPAKRLFENEPGFRWTADLPQHLTGGDRHLGRQRGIDDRLAFDRGQLLTPSSSVTSAWT